MNTSALLENQFLATKFYVPVVQGTIISRPRLTALLAESFRYPLTLISAPAGFGKTTLLSVWAQSYPAGKSLVAWVSLDQEDNELRLFWAYVLSALNKQQPKHFTSLLMQLQSPQGQSLKHILTGLINLLVESWEHFVLILDDYQVITEQEIHSSFSYLVEHLPPQLSIILATRANPPLHLSQLRARQQILEVRADQLRCTAEETRAFFHEVMNIQLPDETIQQVTARTEGWLVGLQLLGLSLSEQTNPDTLLEISGDQRYILDYLTEIVLRQQPPEIQNFLLSTCILERLTGSLCDAVMEQTGSLLLLQRIEQANLFVVSLDNKREWYRYHALFAEALHYQLEQAHADLVPVLHARASRWYAQHQQTTQAILHAFRAQEWHWAADLIEREYLPLISFAWGTGRHAQVLLQQWLEQLPADILSCRPRFCLSCFHMLWTVTPQSLLHIWLDAAEVTLMALLKTQTPGENSQPLLASEAWREQRDLLGEVFTSRAFLWSYTEDGQVALPLCKQALALLSAENTILRALVAITQLIAYYTSSANDVVAAVESGLQAVLLAQTVESPAYTLSIMGVVSLYMIGAGRLHEAERLTQQAIRLGTQPAGFRLPDVGWPAVLQAEIWREWNELDAARSLATEGISQCEQATSLLSLICIFSGYTLLVRVYMSCGELDAACSALQQLERLSRSMNQPWYLHAYSLFTTIDQVRLWLACGELNRATRWAEELEMTERHLTPFAHEREEVACARIFLAKDQPTQALQRLEPVLQRASAGQRWGHVIEIRVLQALAYQMLQEEAQALDVLSEAIKLAEPEGYIRSFVDEGTSMEALLYRLRKQNRKQGPTPYLDRLLAAFQQEGRARMQPGGQTQTQPLPDPLSQREQEVLQLLARGASNQEIGRELVIAVDTVKRHVSHIFAKLGVQNRVQALKQAQELGLLDEEG